LALQQRKARTFAFIALGTVIGMASFRMATCSRLRTVALPANSPTSRSDSTPYDARLPRLGTLETAIGTPASSRRYTGEELGVAPGSTVRDVFYLLVDR